jgi:hypothetical protein
VEALDLASFLRKLDYARADIEEEQKRRLMEMVMFSHMQAQNITRSLLADKDPAADPDAKPPKKDEIRKANRAQRQLQEEWYAALKSAGNYAAFLGCGELFGTKYEGPGGPAQPRSKKERLARALRSAQRFAAFGPTKEEEN